MRRRPRPPDGRDQVDEPPASWPVFLVHAAVFAGRLLGVAHPPHHAAFAGPPVEAGDDVEDHRHPGGSSLDGARSRRPGAGPRPTGCDAPSAHRCQLRTAGDHDPSARAPARGLDAGHPAAVAAPGRGSPCSGTSTPREKRYGVSRHVARRVDVPVAWGERRRQGAAGRHGVDPRRTRPARARSRPARARLHGGRAWACSTSAAREARHVIALGHETGVDAQLGLLAQVEVAAEESEPDRRAACRPGPDHAGGPAARTLSEGAPLEQHDLVQAGPTEEPAHQAPTVPPPTTTASAVPAPAAADWRCSRARRWHRLNGQSTRASARHGGSAMYGLSAQDLELQARARTFVDELIPLEEQAELAGGHLPDGPEAGKHERRPVERGLYATNMPVEYGGGGCTTLQQVLVQEQCGRATNALGLGRRHAARLAARGRHPRADRALREAGRAGREARVLRDHRGGRRLGRRRRSTRPPSATATTTSSTASSGTSRRTTGPTTPSSRRDSSTASSPASTRCSSSTCPARACASSALRRTATRSPRAPDRRVRGCAGAGRQPRRRRGRRHDVRLRVVPVRAADGGRPMPGRRAG